jgi:hypothetical protein
VKQEHQSDDDMKGVMPALKRAARRARELARQTGTLIVVMRDGKLVEETPSSEDQEGSAVGRSA